ACLNHWSRIILHPTTLGFPALPCSNRTLTGRHEANRTDNTARCLRVRSTENVPTITPARGTLQRLPDQDRGHRNDWYPGGREKFLGSNRGDDTSIRRTYLQHSPRCAAPTDDSR